MSLESSFGNSVLENVTCPGCSLLCSDLVIKISGKEVETILGACSHGYQMIKTYGMRGRLRDFTIGLRNVDPEEAIMKSAEILSSSSRPLIYGFDESSNKAIELGLKIAEKVNGVFDTPPSICQPLTPLMASKYVELGIFEDVLDNADMIVFWAANPAETNLRHASKYSVMPRGRSVPLGRENRIVAVVDVRNSWTMKIAQHQIRIDLGGDAELIESLDRMYEGKTLRMSRYMKMASSLINDIRKARYVAFFIGHGLILNGNVKDILLLIVNILRKIGADRKVTLTPIAEKVNSMGASQIPYRIYGYSHALKFSNGCVEHNPISTGVYGGLLRGEFDAALLVKTDPITYLPLNASRKIPFSKTIVLDYRETITSSRSLIRIPLQILGVEVDGEVIRSDGVSVELRRIIEGGSGMIQEEEFLKKLLSYL
jgi:formylmethanofuran dehydrogenase subunit B